MFSTVEAIKPFTSGLQVTRDNQGNPVYCTLHGQELRFIGDDGKDNPLFCGTVELNPDFCRATLANMHPNRKPVKNHVDALAKDMLANRWYLTGETIIFDENAVTTDCQHRCLGYLQACEMSGEPLKGIRVTAVAGVSPSSMLVLDSGKKRTIVDSARISQTNLRDNPRIPITSKHQQIIKAVITQSTASEMVQLLRKFADPIEYTCLPGQKGKDCFCAYPSVRGQIFLACLEYRDQSSTLEKLDGFKYLLDGEYDRHNFTDAEKFEAKYGFNFSDTRAWPLALRHEVEEAKRIKQYGGQARRENSMKAVKAIRAFLFGKSGPAYSDGRRMPIPSGLSKEEFFRNNLTDMKAWNDNSFRSVFGGIMDV